MKTKIRIGCGAGFSGDRLDPAILLAEKGGIDFLVLECLAERTIALAQKRKVADPSRGFDVLLERRIESLLPSLVKNKIRLVTNMGAANTLAGAKKILEVAHRLNVKIRVAAVCGDDLLEYDQLNKEDFALFENEDFAYGLLVQDEDNLVISANAYLGVEGILKALDAEADIIITGRVADPSLFLAPMIHSFNWDRKNYDLLGKGTVIGHLLECAGQLTGGYFADPLKKPVPDPDILGFPIAEIFPDATAILSKIEGTGGVINMQTAKEQLLYEVLNPNQYVTPDVIADFTSVKLSELSVNKVFVSGGGGNPKPETYKVSIGYKAGWMGEAEISYLGSAALERARAAGDCINLRLKKYKEEFEGIHIEYIGESLLHSNKIGRQFSTDFKSIRLRVAAKAKTPFGANAVGEEVEALYTNGPAGGGGVRKHTQEIVGIVSALVNRQKLEPLVYFFES